MEDRYKKLIRNIHEYTTTMTMPIKMIQLKPPRDKNFIIIDFARKPGLYNSKMIWSLRVFTVTKSSSSLGNKLLAL